MGRIGRLRPAGAGAAAAIVVCLAPQAGAHPRGTAWRWSAPRLIARSPNPILAVDCPTSSICVAADADQVLTFTPGRAGPDAAAPVGLGSSALVDISCPSRDQCTAVATDGAAVTFDPAAPEVQRTRAVTRRHAAIDDVDCPAVDRCIALTREAAVTFDPRNGAAPVPHPLPPGSGDSARLACPTSRQCTVIADAVSGQGGAVETYDPSRTATAAPVSLPFSPRGIACATARQCTVVGDTEEVTFDPVSMAALKPVAVVRSADAPFLDGQVACPSTHLCTSNVSGPAVESFDPLRPGFTRETSLAIKGGATDLSCPSAGRCIAVDSVGGASGFDPRSARRAHPVGVDEDGAGPLVLSCPSSHVCSGLDPDGELGFDPGSGRALGALASSGIILPGPVCTSAIRCTVVDNATATTYDPTGSAAPKAAPIAASATVFDADALACPSPRQCTAFDGDSARSTGREVTFDPVAVRSHRPSPLRLTPATSHGAGIVCPSVHQCTVVSGGTATTFDPRAPGSVMRARLGGETAGVVSCPSGSLCLAGIARGVIVRFDPRSSAHARRTVVDPAGAISALACPSPVGCVAVDSRGGAVAFDPLAPASTHRAVIDPWPLVSLSCPTPRLCLAGDLAGHVVLGRLTGPTA